MVVGLLPEVDIVVRDFDTTDDPLEVDDLFVDSQDMRVFVLNMYVNHAKNILCEVGIYAHSQALPNIRT